MAEDRDRSPNALLSAVSRVEGKVNSIDRTVAKHDKLLQGEGPERPGLLTIVYTVQKEMRGIHRAAWLVLTAIVTLGTGVLTTAIVALLKLGGS